MRASTALLLALGLAPFAVCCAPAGAGSEGPPRATHRFDPQAVETVEGRVLGVDRTSAQDQLSYGVHFTVRDDLG